jgi:hypothetical protein
MPARVSHQARKDLDTIITVREAVERAGSIDLCAGNEIGRCDRDIILQLVGPRIDIAGVVCRHSIGSQIDSKAAILIDRVAQHVMSGPCRDINAVTRIKGNRVARSRPGAAYHAAGAAVYVNAMSRIGDAARARRIETDIVPVDDIPARAIGELDAITVVAGDDVSR